MASTHRGLSLPAAIALVMGNMIGSGVFLLPASLAPYGWASVVGWIITIAGSLVLAALLCRLTLALPERQGVVALVEAALGDRAGFFVGWSYWVSIWTATATIAIAAVSYLSLFFPSLATQPALGVGAAVALLWLMTALNLVGAQQAGRFQVLTLALKIVPLIAVIALAGWVLLQGTVAIVPLSVGGALSGSAVNAAGVLTLWAMLGFESASVAADKVAAPAYTIPRATLWGTALAGLLYLLSCSAIVLMVPQARLAASNAPFADFVSLYWGDGTARWVAVFAAISAIGALNGWVLLQGELPFSMARAGRLPAWLARARSDGTPTAALVGSSIVASLLLAASASHTLGDVFTATALLSTSASLWLYLAIALAALRTGVARGLALAGGGYALWALWGAGWQTSGLSLLLMATGVPLLWWARSGRTARVPL